MTGGVGRSLYHCIAPSLQGWFYACLTLSICFRLFQEYADRSVLFSSVTCASSLISCRIQFWVLVLARKTSIFISVVSFRLSPLSSIRVSFDDSGSRLHPVVLISSITVSVTWVFFLEWNCDPSVQAPTWRTSWFEIGVFLLQDGLPSKAKEFHLPVVWNRSLPSPSQTAYQG